MLIVSVGTVAVRRKADLNPEEMNLLYNMKSIPSTLMFAALNEQDFLCRSSANVSQGTFGPEVGDMMARGPCDNETFSMSGTMRTQPMRLTALGFRIFIPKTFGSSIQ